MLLNNKSPHFPVITVYHKKTFTGVLTNFLSFTPPCYKRGLVKTLIDRTFKINNTWLGFHNDLQNLLAILRKNLYPEHVLDMLLHRYVTTAVEGNDTRPSTGVEQPELPRHYYKIPYIGYFSGVAQRRARKLIKLVNSTFEIKNLFNVKDPLPDRFRTRIVYTFSCYIGETSRHFSTRVHEHMSVS